MAGLIDPVFVFGGAVAGTFDPGGVGVGIKATAPGDGQFPPCTTTTADNVVHGGEPETTPEGLMPGLGLFPPPTGGRTFLELQPGKNAAKSAVTKIRIDVLPINVFRPYKEPVLEGMVRSAAFTMRRLGTLGPDA